MDGEGPLSAMEVSRARKSLRSVSSRKMLVRSIPRTITRCRVSGTSRRDWRGTATRNVSQGGTDCSVFQQGVQPRPWLKARMH